jgi:hypothetical protein
VSPFQEFRFWARRAPGSERAVAGVAAVLAVVLFAWLLVPGDASSSTDLLAAGGGATGTTATGAAATGAAATGGGTTDTTAVGAGGATGTGAGSSGASGASGGGGSTGAAPGAAAATGQQCPPGSSKGISEKQVKIGVGIVQIVGPAANSVFGVATPEAQRAAFDAVITALNAEGGFGCKQAVAQYFNLNPVNKEELVQGCRDAADAGVFAFVDSGAYVTYPQVECFGQRKIAYFGGYFGNSDRNERNYPYLFNLNLLDTTYRNGLLALKARGAFGAGYKKLGFLFRDCDKPLVDGTKRTMREVVPENTIVEYSVGCPNDLANPADLQAAVLTFQRAGVTHVTTLGMLGDMSNFTNIAEQQKFRPHYVQPDDGIISVSYGSQGPNPANFANAIAIVTNRGGEERTPGMTLTPGTVRCNGYFKAKGLKPVWDQPYAIGNACNQLLMLKASMDNAAALRPDALAAGLQKAKSIDFSYPQGPNDFAAVPHTTTGGQFYRTAQFYEDCACWKLIDRDFKPILR